jgi:hypothetical protein
MITVQDHLGVAIPLIVFVLIVTGVGVTSGPGWLAPAFISVLMAVLVFDGAYQEWAEERRAGGGSMSPKEAVAILEGQTVTLNGHKTNHGAVLRACWHKLAQGATEDVVEDELNVAFPQPEGQEKRYQLVANPHLDFFFGRMRLLQAVEIVTVRVPASPYERSFPTNPATRRPGAVVPQEVIGPTDEQRYVLTQFGSRIVELLVSSPTPDTGGNSS